MPSGTVTSCSLIFSVTSFVSVDTDMVVFASRPVALGSLDIPTSFAVFNLPDLMRNQRSRGDSDGSVCRLGSDHILGIFVPPTLVRSYHRGGGIPPATGLFRFIADGDKARIGSEKAML